MIRSLLSSLVIALVSTVAVAADGAPGALVISVRRWEGEYETNGHVTPSTASIYALRADGSDLREIVAIPGAVCASPAYGPEGDWLYFQTNASGAYHLVRCRPDGSDRRPLTGADRPGPPWTAVFGLQMTQSGSILCSANRGDAGCVALLSPDDGRLDLVAPQLGYLYMSALSPEGDAVVASGPASGYRLWLLKLPESLATGDAAITAPSLVLTPDHPDCYAQRFTPDGRTILFIRRDGDLYRVERDGTGLKRISEGNGYVEFRLSPKDQHGSTDAPDLSPDGSRIASIAVRDGVPNVWIRNIDGTQPRQVTFRKTPCGRVRWSPDGRHLAFVSFVGKYPQLFTVPVDGGEPQQLTNLEGAVYSVEWAPAVRRPTSPER